LFWSKKKFLKRNWDLSPKEKQSENVEKEKNIKNVESKKEKKSEEKKNTLEKLHWNHVLAILNFLQNVKKTPKPPNVQENSTNVQEDVWEKHAKFVLELHVLEKLKKRNAEELVQEDAENFIWKKHHRKSHKKSHKKHSEKTKVVVTETTKQTEQTSNVVVSESTKKEIKSQIQKIKQLPEHIISTYTQTIASHRCGSGDNNKECRDRVEEYSRNQEALFRVSALKSCKCESTTTSVDGVKSCTNTCFKNACNIRAVNECVTLADQTSCVHKINTKCTTLHVSQ